MTPSTNGPSAHYKPAPVPAPSTSNAAPSAIYTTKPYAPSLIASSASSTAASATTPPTTSTKPGHTDNPRRSLTRYDPGMSDPAYAPSPCKPTDSATRPHPDVHAQPGSSKDTKVSESGAKGTRTPDPHTASVKTPVLQRVTASTVYRIMPACNPSSY